MKKYKICSSVLEDPNSLEDKNPVYQKVISQEPVCSFLWSALTAGLSAITATKILVSILFDAVLLNDL